MATGRNIRKTAKMDGQAWAKKVGGKWFERWKSEGLGGGGGGEQEKTGVATEGINKIEGYSTLIMRKEIPARELSGRKEE